MSPSTVTQAAWNELSEKDQIILKSLGIKIEIPKPPKTLGTKNPVSVARRLSVLHTAPTEYYMEVQSHCECCDGVQVKAGKMTLLQPRDRQLNFVEGDIPEGAVIKVKKLFPVNCNQCTSRLLKLSKEELVAKVMSLTTIALMKGWL